ncbi:MAG: ribbon-helix-helix protein, CopG family [Candidatus Thorarchaeota archaeon]|jgi:predicted transcriptional regulator
MYTKIVSVYLSNEMHRQIEEIAKKQSRSLTYLVREAIKKVYLNGQDLDLDTEQDTERDRKQNMTQEQKTNQLSSLIDDSDFNEKNDK